MSALKQFLSVARFEFTYQLRNPVLMASSGLFFLATFGLVTIDAIQIGAGGNVNVNSPFAINQITMVMAILALFPLTAFVANAVTRDDESGFGPILRATQLRKGAYLFGRFTGAWIAAAIGFLAIPLAILIGTFMPWLDEEKLGPLIMGHYGFAYGVVGLPMLFVFGSMLFALATAARSMMGAYLGLIAILAGWVATGILFDKPETRDIAAFLDPTGIAALFHQTQIWTSVERNTRLPEFVGVFLQNRVLWGSFALACLAASYFMYRTDGKAMMALKQQKSAAAAGPPIVPFAPVVAPALDDTVRTAQMWARTRFDVKSVILSPSFFVLLIIGLFNSLSALLYANEQGGTTIEPVTRLMVGALQSGFSFIPTIIAGLYAGELVWRDRQRRIAEIIDATPITDYALLLPKVAAILVVLLVANFIGMMTAIGVQIYKGHTDFELMGYLLWWILPTTISGLQIAILAIFFQTISPNKYVGWGFLLAYLIASSALLSALGLQHNLYNFGSGPKTPISAFNGLGHFWVGKAWFDLYWSAFCVVLIIVTYGLWRRGAETRLFPRLVRFPSRLRGGAGWVFGTAMISFIGMGSWIFYNTNVLNIYTPSSKADETLAASEKALAQYEDMAGPIITDIKFNINLRPNDRQADVIGSYVIQNQTGAPLKRMIARMPKRASVERATLSLQNATKEKDWPEFDVTLYRFDVPMAPGEKRVLNFQTTYGRKGFTNDRGQHRVVANGTFISNEALAPILRVSRSDWMTDATKRRKYGLDPRERPIKLGDPKGDAHHYFRPDSHWVNADITVTTTEDQIPVAPGYLVSESKAAGRITRRFVSQAPIHNFFSIQSARYNVRRSQVEIAGKPVAVELYYHPTHTRNLEAMENATHAALSMFSERFSTYQFQQFRILEFPAYSAIAQSFANTVPFSEDIGWLQANRDPNKIDLVTLVTAHEVAHQWFAHQFIGADKQGATMLSESLAEYAGLLVVEKLLGPSQVRKFLQYEQARYLGGRGTDSLEELPLVQVENQPYIHYHKGALVMYFLRNELGEEVINSTIRKLIDRFAFKPAPYPTSADFVTILRAEVGSDPIKQQLITDVFEKITLYEAKVGAARKVKLANGRWQILLTLEARKLYADGSGKEIDAPMTEPWEIGIFTRNPRDNDFSQTNVLAFERRMLRSGRQQIEITLPQGAEPAFAGIDPYLKRIDRNPADNLMPLAQ
jgi:ABC-2 type transport system permease protein